jgi:peptidoglycan hydrolase-like protein with peptidoglycan-binding domain
MRVQKATHLALTLLLTAGLGVRANAAARQSSAPKNSAPSKSSSSAHKSKSSKHSKGKASRRQRGQKAPTPDRISEIQQALAKDGSFTGTPSGKWDNSTVEAMKKFQTTHGLAPTGKLDAKTLQQLGLGSPTAGVAAPMPSVASSAATSSKSQINRRQQ